MNTPRSVWLAATALALAALFFSVAACSFDSEPDDKESLAEVAGGGDTSSKDSGSPSDRASTPDRQTGEGPRDAGAPDTRGVDGTLHDQPTGLDTSQPGDPATTDAVWPDNPFQPDLGLRDEPPAADVGAACTGPCDCAQGLDCISGKCVRTTMPVYCCERKGCPSGKPCVKTGGGMATCPKIPACLTHCHCPQGLACLDGQCVGVGSPIYCCDKPGCPAGQTCYDVNGTYRTCGNPAGGCKHTCDCPQGLLCLSGACLSTNPPTYCCDSANCPSGKWCQYRVGGFGYCKPSGTGCTSVCDCPADHICMSGSCVKSPGLYCCDKGACPAGASCEDTKGNRRMCGSGKTCRSTCDCPVGEICFNGTCVGSTKPTPCCTAPVCPRGQVCVEPSGGFGYCK